MELHELEKHTSTLLQKVKRGTLFHDYLSAVQMLVFEVEALREKDEEMRQKKSWAGKMSRSNLTQEERTEAARKGGLARAKQRSERGF